MRTYEEYKKILELWELGFPKKRIAIIIGIPSPITLMTLFVYSVKPVIV